MSEAPRPCRSVPSWAAGVVIAAAVLLTTMGRFRNEFVFDDVFLIGESDFVHDFRNLPSVFTESTGVALSRGDGSLVASPTYRPITLATFFMDSWISGRDPWGYQLTNCVLHVLCGLLVYTVALRRLGAGSSLFALAGALGFALHPWLAEAHVWINGRSDVLALLFGLAALLVSNSQQLGGSFLAGVLLLLGLLSKESLIGGILALALWATAQSGRDDRIRTIAPFGIATLVYLGLRLWALEGLTGDVAWPAEAWIEAGSRFPVLFFDSLRHAVIPGVPYLRSLHDEYDHVPGVALVALSALFVLLTVLLFVHRRRHPTLIWAFVWFAGTLAPSAIVTTQFWPGHGRLLYLPIAGLALAGAVWFRDAIVAMPRFQWVLAGGAALYLATFALGLARVTEDYKDNETLFRAITIREPRAAHGYGLLGLHWARSGRPLEAITALREALIRDPGNHLYLSRLGHELAEVGDLAGASEIAAEGLRRFAGRRESAPYHLLTVRVSQDREPGRLVDHLLACLELQPNRPDCERTLEYLVFAAPDRESFRREACAKYVLAPGPIGARWRRFASVCP